MKYEILSLQPLKVEKSSYAGTLEYLQSRGIVKIKYVEFSLFKQFQIILRGIEKSPISRVFKNFCSLLELLVTKDKTLLIGAAPNNAIILLLNRLKAKHKCIFFASWPYWDGERYAEAEVQFFPSQVKAWHRFINGIISVGVNKSVCEALAKRGAIVFHIPYAIDTDLFRPDLSRRSSNTVKVLFVGHLLKLKGVHLILNIIEKQKWENVEFWFVGRGAYKSKIIKMQQQGYPIRYFGYITNRRDMASIYQQSDIFILPSMKIGRNEEKFGMVLIEAIACQLPVITTDCVGPKQIIEHGKTGIVIPQNDERALTDAIDKLVKSPQLRSELGKNGRNKAEETYDIRENAERWLEVIELVNHT